MNKYKTYIKRQGFRAINFLISENANQTLTSLEQSSLQTNDNELHARSCMLLDVISNLFYVRVVKSSIDFIQDEKWRGLVTMDCEQ